MVKKIKIEFPTPLPFGEDFAAAWAIWLRYRAERRLPAYRPTGLEITFKRLVKDSGNDEQAAVDAIEYSISQNWQGIYFQYGTSKNKRGPNGTGSNMAGSDVIRPDKTFGGAL